MHDDGFTHQEYEDLPSDPFAERTEEAYKAEQDERDALIEDDIPRPWVDIQGNNTPQHVAVDLIDEIAGYVRNMTALYEAGLPEDTMTASVAFNMLNGGLLIGSLQLAGIYAPSLRPHLDKLLAGIHNAMPVATPEQTELVEGLVKKIALERVEEFKASMAQTEDVLAHADDGPDFDASNN